MSILSLPQIRDDEEWVLVVMASARTAVASLSRVPLDNTKFKNDGSYDYYITSIAMEETSGGLMNLAIEILDLTRKRNILASQASLTTFGKPNPTATTANNTVGLYTSNLDLDAAYRLPADGGLAITLEELGGAARTARVTIIGYQRMPKLPPLKP